jgi:hypothetical protein
MANDAESNEERITRIERMLAELTALQLQNPNAWRPSRATE